MRMRTCVIYCALRDLRHVSAGSTAGRQWKTSLQRFDQCRSAYAVSDAYTEGAMLAQPMLSITQMASATVELDALPLAQQ